MAAKEAKVFLLELELKTQGKIVGDSTAKHGPLDFSKGLMCTAFEYDVVSQYDPGSGQLTGRRVHQPFTIVRERDSASVAIFQSVCTNEQVVTATLSFARPNNAGQLAIYDTFKLETGAIVEYKSWHGVLPGSGESMAQEQTNEMELFKLTFDGLTFDNLVKSKSSSDYWSKQT